MKRLILMAFVLSVAAACSAPGHNEVELSISTEDGGEASITFQVLEVVHRGDTARLYEVLQENLTGGTARYRSSVTASGACDLSGFGTLGEAVPANAVSVELPANTPSYVARARDVPIPNDCQGKMELHVEVVDELNDSRAEATIPFEIN